MGRDPLIGVNQQFAWVRLAICLGLSDNLSGVAWLILIGFAQFLFSIYLVLKYLELTSQQQQQKNLTNKRLDLALRFFFFLACWFEKCENKK